MAEKNGFPQIPSTVWWGVRAILQRTPTATVDERMLSVQLGVQEAAARQYIAELRRASILNDDNKATPLAQRWRLDQTYSEAVEEILSATYPEGLLQVAPPGDGERQKVVNWFLHEGLGQGAAGNKAATYLLIGSRDPNEAPTRSAGTKSKGEKSPRPVPKTSAAVAGKTASSAASTAPEAPPSGEGYRHRADAIPLNVNVQIHIGADAGIEQIDAIFSAMKRYLHDDPAS